MKKALITAGILLLASCSSNRIHFDLDKKGIVSCHGSPISQVMIRGLEDNVDYYRFSLRERGESRGVLFFDVVKIDDVFETFTHLGKKIDGSEFGLRPSSKYEIHNISNGDAAESSVVITLDKDGIIVDADVVDCD